MGYGITKISIKMFIQLGIIAILSFLLEEIMDIFFHNDIHENYYLIDLMLINF